MSAPESLDRLLCIVFPRRCAYCGEVILPEAHVCDACLKNLPRILPPVCPLCAHQKEDCRCKQKKQEYDGACAPFYYEDAVVKAVHRLKFENKDFTANTFALDMAAVVRQEYADITFDAVTFVPFTKKQMRRRAFNPAEVLAEALARALSLPKQNLLVKLYETRTQHLLKSSERAGNVLGVFSAVENVNLEGKTLLLVDDIKTTGATLSECAKMLKLAGAKEVVCCTFAATRLQKENT